MSRPDIANLRALILSAKKPSVRQLMELLDYVAELEEQRDELEAANLTFGKAMQELEGYRSRDNGYMKRALEAQKG